MTSASLLATASWHATTIDVTDIADLNDIARGDGFLFVKDGVGIAGRGEIARVDEHNIKDFLSSIHNDHRSTSLFSGPRAFGLIPFNPSKSAKFIVPQILIGKDTNGATWLTVIQSTTLVQAERDQNIDSVVKELQTSVNRPPVTATSFTVEPLTPIETYLSAVSSAREAVRNNAIKKAVIARDIQVLSECPINLHSVLLRLKASFGSSYRYSIDGLIGASPELLVEVRDGIARSNPLAGTTTRTGDPSTDATLATELLTSTKNQIEHRVVVDMVHDTLLRWCSFLDWEPEPSIVAVANVQHLGTRVEGPLSNATTHVLDVARDLCPTPALGGYPRDAAVALIDKVEGMSRGWYGGAVGWCDQHGNGTWAVTIRCAEFTTDRKTARLFAGGGIVADSDPLSELAETQVKFQAMLSAIIRP